MKNNKKTLINILCNLFLQICTIISGFIIPKIILTNFGSEANGLVSSLNQMLNYIALVEGGITGVITATLYKPLVDNDTKKISSIVNAADSFFKKIGIIFIVYSLILAIIYPLIFNVSFSYSYVFCLTIILSMNLLIQYMFSLTYKTLLTADKKLYIVSITQSVMIILNIFLSIISVNIYPNIHILKLINGILFLLQPIVFKIYINKNYNLNKKEEKNLNLIKSRWDGFAINVAAFMHSCTDITVLTIFTNLKIVSIYGVFSLVTNGIKSIITAISNAIAPTIGRAYAIGKSDELNKKMDIYEFIMLFLIFFVFTTAALMINSFVMIYTKGISDANYNQELFGYLIVISEALYLLKFPQLNLAYSANKFKDITIPAYIEAAINIIISIILVQKFGLIGVALGTILAMIYRLIFQVNYINKMIDYRNGKKYYLKMLFFLIGAIFSIIICKCIINLTITDLISWIIAAATYSVITFIVYFIISIIFFRNEINYLKKYMR